MSGSRFVVHDGTSYVHTMTVDETETLCEIPLPTPLIGKWYRSKKKADVGLYPCQFCEEVFAGARTGEQAVLLRVDSPSGGSVSATLPGVLVVREEDRPASSLRGAIDRLLERMGDRRVSVVITSSEPLAKEGP